MDPSRAGSAFQSSVNLDSHPGTSVSNSVGFVSGLLALAQAETRRAIAPNPAQVTTDLRSLFMATIVPEGPQHVKPGPRLPGALEITASGRGPRRPRPLPHSAPAWRRYGRRD